MFSQKLLSRLLLRFLLQLRAVIPCYFFLKQLRINVLTSLLIVFSELMENLKTQSIFWQLV